MTGPRVAALVMIPVAIVAGIVGGHLWRVAHAPKVAALADRPAIAVPDRPAPPTSSPPHPAPATSVPQATGGSASADAASPHLDTTKPPASKPEGRPPSFDVVRVEPQGDAVVAGKGAPDAQVALLSGGKVVGEAKSDANGQFVILPQRLAPGDHALTLRQTSDGKPASDSAQSVAVSVPQPGKDKSKVVVALAEPGKATKLLSPPPGADAGAPMSEAPGGKVVVRSAELENGTGLYVTGAARPGTSVHVYLNDSHLADIVAGADGAWSVRVNHGLTGGHYTVRADAAAAGGKVASRAEVPFDVPVLMAEAAKTPVVSPPTPAKPKSPPASAPTGPAAPTAPPTPAETAGADATIESIATARVTRGDNLWNISRFRLGDGMRYTQIYAANSDQIRDPDLIYPGQVFVVPNR